VADASSVGPAHAIVAGPPTAAATYRRLLRYAWPYRLVVLAVIVPAALYALINTFVPYLMNEFVALLEDPERDPTRLWMFPVGLAIAFPLRAAMDIATVYGLAWVGRSVIRDLRNEVFQRYLRLPSGYFDRGSTGMLISRLTYNTEQVAEAISNAVVILLRDTMAIIVLIVVMLRMSPTLTLLVAIVGPVIAVVIGAMSRAFRRYGSRIQTSMGDVTRITEEALHGQRVVKLFDGAAREERQFRDVTQRNFRFNTRLVAVLTLGDSLTQYAIVLGVAAVMWASFADLNPPEFIGFITAMGMVLTPLKRLINVNAVIQRGITGAASVFEIIDEPLEHDAGTKTIERARGDVEFVGVAFSYDSTKGNVLNDVSIAIPAGTTVALVGQSGSGKSTLASLVPRFYDPQHGAVLLDGEDVRNYTLLALRRQIGLVSQDVVLFDDTIANNIAYGALADRSRADVERAAEAAYVTEFAADLPQGLDTRVGERGALLSGGQRQRVAIARALLKDAPVLILDEATSALDAESERRVQAALARLMQGRTTLVIAHRLSTVERADRIVVMREGKIVETGTHRELLAAGGYYASLHKMQFSE
jgi:subfamily B ATP-binding cassette protein MsbA